MSDTAPAKNYVYQPIPAIPDWFEHKDPPIFAVAGPDVDVLDKKATWCGKPIRGITKSEAERIAMEINRYWERK